MKTLRFIVGLLVMSSFFTACQKSEIVERPVFQEITSEIKVELKDGALHFAAKEDLIGTLRAMSKMTEQELDAWEDEIGFTSVRRLTNQALSRLEGLENLPAGEVEAFLSQVLRSEKWIESSENIVQPVLHSRGYRSICNSEGIYYAVGTLNRISKNHIIGIENGDMDLLEQVELDLTHRPEEGIHVLDMPERVVFTNSRSCAYFNQAVSTNSAMFRVRLVVSSSEDVSLMGPWTVRAGTVSVNSYSECFEGSPQVWRKFSGPTLHIEGTTYVANSWDSRRHSIILSDMTGGGGSLTAIRYIGEPTFTAASAIPLIQIIEAESFYQWSNTEHKATIDCN